MASAPSSPKGAVLTSPLLWWSGIRKRSLLQSKYVVELQRYPSPATSPVRSCRAAPWMRSPALPGCG